MRSSAARQPSAAASGGITTPASMPPTCPGLSGRDDQGAVSGWGSPGEDVGAGWHVRPAAEADQKRPGEERYWQGAQGRDRSRAERGTHSAKLQGAHRPEPREGGCPKGQKEHRAEEAEAVDLPDGLGGEAGIAHHQRTDRGQSRQRAGRDYLNQDRGAERGDPRRRRGGRGQRACGLLLGHATVLRSTRRPNLGARVPQTQL
jgi:hypothetical protein